MGVLAVIPESRAGAAGAIDKIDHRRPDLRVPQRRLRVAAGSDEVIEVAIAHGIAIQAKLIDLDHFASRVELQLVDGDVVRFLAGQADAKLARGHEAGLLLQRLQGPPQLIVREIRRDLRPQQQGSSVLESASAPPGRRYRPAADVGHLLDHGIHLALERFAR